MSGGVTGYAYTLNKYMTHFDTFVATRRKVSWALRGGTTAKTDERYPQSSAWQSYAVCGRAGVRRLRTPCTGLTVESVSAHHGGTHQPRPLKSYRSAVRRALILLHLRTYKTAKFTNSALKNRQGYVIIKMIKI